MKLFEKLDIVKSQLENWWNYGDQDKPLILSSYLPKKVLDTDNLVQFWTDTDFIIDRTMQIIDNTVYEGVALPFHYVDHGSSAGSLVLGSKMDYVDKETIWAHPVHDSIEEIIDIQQEKNNYSYKTIMEITQKSAALSHNHHFVAPFALGGLTDNIAGLYGTENLLLDMIGNPTAVKKTMENMKRIWIENFNSVQNIIKPAKNPGGIGWIGIWAPETTFPIQEDFSYMISPAMYREFCLPHIIDIAETMEYAFYHLDGIGALPHLETVLEIEKIKVIQWVPGAGKEKISDWYDVIKKIIAHKKSVQVFANAEEIDELVKNVGTKGLMVVLLDSSENNSKKYLAKYFD